jgi:thioredoxin-disulfide reductase/thioredoxin
MRKTSLLLLILPIFSLLAVEPVLILGGGIGAMTSALYLARAGYHPLIIEGKTPGGLLTQSHSVQNWPGEIEITGADLAEKLREQVTANGARFLKGEVVAVDFSKRPYTVFTRSLDGEEKKREIQAESCIIAMGTTPNHLGIPGEKEYWGKGVTNCAICDGSLYQGKVVGVVGGGDAAVLEALYLSNIANEVYLFVRKDSLKAVEEKRVETLLAKPNVKILFNTTVEAVKGTPEEVTHVLLKTGKESPRAFSLDGLFLAIGSKPNSQVFQGALKLGSQGHIILTQDQQTSLEGIYAIGDISDPHYKQAVTAAGDGAKAALQAQDYLTDHRGEKPLALAGEIDEEAIVADNAAYGSDITEIESMGQFEMELEDRSLPILLDFYATWCGPCKQAAPMIHSAAKKLAGKYKFLKIDVDKFPELVSKYQIKGMPTVILLDKSGKIKEREMGYEPIVGLLQRL